MAQRVRQVVWDAVDYIFSTPQPGVCVQCHRPLGGGGFHAHLPKENIDLEFCSQYCGHKYWVDYKRHCERTAGRSVCSLPGCNKPCYREGYKIHDYCGRTHAKEHKAMMEGMERDRRKHHFGGGGSGGGGFSSGNSSFFKRSGPIKFYNRGEPYYEFTNFYEVVVLIDRKHWPTTEHYFQAQKFVDPLIRENIRMLSRPCEAFDMSHNPRYSRWRRPDWEAVKEDVMYRALQAKFSQNRDLRQLLLDTGERKLIEHSPHDSYWGDGGDGTGKNRLGALLMELRDEMRTKNPETSAHELQKRLEKQLQQTKERAQKAEEKAQEVEKEVRKAEERAHLAEEREQHIRETLEQRVRQAEARANDLQRRLDEVEEREQERLAVQQQANAAEQRGPSWEVRGEDLELTGEVIGTGGWAEVRVAHLTVAAKNLHRQLVYDYHRQLFQREMAVAARISHPNLLRFHGAKLEGGMTILTELMPTSLRDEVERGHRYPEHRLSREHILSIAMDVARALNYLHLLIPDPIVHRDLSSANVLLKPTPNGGWLAKVSDYGSANFQQQLQTQNPGSPVYAAPESHNPNLQSPKMDIYSFGVLLIEMCTCDFPVPEHRPQLIKSIQYSQLVELIRRCLKEDQNQRPPAIRVIKDLHAL